MGIITISVSEVIHNRIRLLSSIEGRRISDYASQLISDVVLASMDGEKKKDKKEEKEKEESD